MNLQFPPLPAAFLSTILIFGLLVGCAPTYHANENTAFSASAKDAIVVLGITSTKPTPAPFGITSRVHQQFWVSWTTQPTGHIRYYTDDVIEAQFFGEASKAENSSGEITQYRVLRIPAGTYYLRYLESGNRVERQNRFFFEPTNGQLLYFTVAPGEAIYIGDLICDASSGAPRLTGIRRNDDHMIASMTAFPNIDRKPVYRALKRYGMPSS